MPNEVVLIPNDDALLLVDDNNNVVIRMGIPPKGWNGDLAMNPKGARDLSRLLLIHAQIAEEKRMKGDHS